jgi:hypothetical protein
VSEEIEHKEEFRTQTEAENMIIPFLEFLSLKFKIINS